MEVVALTLYQDGGTPGAQNSVQYFGHAMVHAAVKISQFAFHILAGHDTTQD